MDLVNRYNDFQTGKTKLKDLEKYITKVEANRCRWGYIHAFYLSASFKYDKELIDILNNHYRENKEVFLHYSMHNKKYTLKGFISSIDIFNGEEVYMRSLYGEEAIIRVMSKK